MLGAGGGWWKEEEEDNSLQCLIQHKTFPQLGKHIICDMGVGNSRRAILSANLGGGYMLRSPACRLIRKQNIY